MSNSGLYRSRQNKMIAGVMGGIAERLGWNATLLRIGFVLLSLLSAAFPGILIYLILWLVIPQRNLQLNSTYTAQGALRTVVDDQHYKP